VHHWIGYCRILGVIQTGVLGLDRVTRRELEQWASNRDGTAERLAGCSVRLRDFTKDPAALEALGFLLD